MPDVHDPPPGQVRPLWPFIVVATAAALGLFAAGILLTLDIGYGYLPG